MRANSSSSISETFLPFSQYCPCDGVSRQPIRFIKVDLPDPDGPVMATYSPRRTSNDTPWSACTFSAPMSYVFQRSRIAMSELVLPSAEGNSGLTTKLGDIAGVSIVASAISTYHLRRAGAGFRFFCLSFHARAFFQGLEHATRTGYNFSSGLQPADYFDVRFSGNTGSHLDELDLVVLVQNIEALQFFRLLTEGRWRAARDRSAGRRRRRRLLD